jgi:hypothetical protein
MWINQLKGALALCASFSPQVLGFRQPYDYLQALRSFQNGYGLSLYQTCSFPRPDDDLWYRFLNPSTIVQMVKSPALADDIIGRVDVTTSA